MHYWLNQRISSGILQGDSGKKNQTQRSFAGDPFSSEYTDVNSAPYLVKTVLDRNINC